MQITQRPLRPPEPKGINKTIKLNPIKHGCWNLSVVEQNRREGGRERIFAGERRDLPTSPLKTPLQHSMSVDRKKAKRSTIHHVLEGGILCTISFNYVCLCVFSC